MKANVLGAGAWGTAFAHVLIERGHEVTIACRDARQATAIAETKRNPRYLSDVHLGDVDAVALDDGLPDADVTVIAVPSRSFAEVVRSLPPTGRCSA